MTIEKKIDLQDLDLLSFWGVNNRNFKFIEVLFPALVLNERGHSLTVRGEEGDLEEFDSFFTSLLRLQSEKGMLDEKSIMAVMTGNSMQGVTEDTILVYGVNGLKIKPRTRNQERMVREIERNDMLFAIGPAGSGKTYTAVALAVRALKSKQVRRIILTRPAVEAGEALGFLPGDLKDKLDPYLQPLYDALRDMLSQQKLDAFLQDKTIEIAPLAFMRGRTLENAFVILDEAQNATSLQLKMFLTRMGRHSKFIITGDVTQTDLPAHQTSGLLPTLDKLKEIGAISIVELQPSDIIRHPLVTEIVRALG